MFLWKGRLERNLQHVWMAFSSARNLFDAGLSFTVMLWRDGRAANAGCGFVVFCCCVWNNCPLHPQLRHRCLCSNFFTPSRGSQQPDEPESKITTTTEKKNSDQVPGQRTTSNKSKEMLILLIRPLGIFMFRCLLIFLLSFSRRFTSLLVFSSSDSFGRGTLQV